MKIAVATDDNKTITGHVGRCRAFIVFEIENGVVLNREIRSNQFTDHVMGTHKHGHGGGSGHQRLADALHDCQYLISHGMGWRLVEDLKQYNITPIVTSELNADAAAIKLEEGKLGMDDDLICRHH